LPLSVAYVVVFPFPVAQIALIVQNSSVVLCSILLICLIHYNEELGLVWNGVGKTVLIACVIVVAVIANLGSEASKIALEKDWIVVLSGGDEAKLASMFQVYTNN
jgi:iron-regulated transporter 1